MKKVLKSWVTRAESKVASLHCAMRQTLQAADLSAQSGDFEAKRRIQGQADTLATEMLRAESELAALRERRYRRSRNATNAA